MKYISAAIQWFNVNVKQNQSVYAYFIHALFSYFFVSYTHYKLGLNIWIACIIWTIFTAFLEYWYDANYEKNPPQTFRQNTLDFISYQIGLWATVGLICL